MTTQTDKRGLFTSHQKTLLDRKYSLSLLDFFKILNAPEQLTISNEVYDILDEGRDFINHLLEKEERVYGITTGFGSLRNQLISSEKASELSINLIRSHDAGIGHSFPQDLVLGAMITRLHTLSKGNSGFSKEALQTLCAMINHQIIPEIPCTGSLGASGDLAFLARLGRAMMGDPVQVTFQGKKMLASKALQQANILPFVPLAKEALALTNGTSFMASMLAIGFKRELNCLNHLIASTGLFLNATGALDIAFYESIHAARNQNGQSFIANIFRGFFERSDLIDRREIQNDYCIRCIPQIFGPRIEMILSLKDKIEKELNAITDNPLLFKGEEVSKDVNPLYLHEYQGEKWAILSGGNFHGENLTTYADIITLSNAKIGLTLERQFAYMLNPLRNNQVLPNYLVANPEKIGLQSGFMIPHYTANALVHKMCLIAQPSSLMNSTSSNEAEDVVSYGATACHKLLDQMDLFEQLLSIHLLTSAQAYSIARKKQGAKNPIAEALFQIINEQTPLPKLNDDGFDNLYEKMTQLIYSQKLVKVLPDPLAL